METLRKNCGHKAGNQHSCDFIHALPENAPRIGPGSYEPGLDSNASRMAIAHNHKQ
jgi:hypothetical protein